MALVLKNSLQDRLSSVFATQSALGVITANPQLDVPLSIAMNSEVNSSRLEGKILSGTYQSVLLLLLVVRLTIALRVLHLQHRIQKLIQ